MGTREISIKESREETLQIWRQNWLEKWESIKAPATATPREIVQQHSLMLGELGSNAEGGDLGLTVVKATIFGVVKFFGYSWDGNQIKECAELIYRDYKKLGIAEYKYFVDRIKTGKYVSQKNFCPALLMEWINNFYSEIVVLKYNMKSEEWVPAAELVSDEVFNAGLQDFYKMMDTYRRQEAQAEKLREEERKDRLLNERDKLLISSMEDGMMDGYAPMPQMLEQYLIAIDRVSIYDKKYKSNNNH